MFFEICSLDFNLWWLEFGFVVSTWTCSDLNSVFCSLNLNLQWVELEFVVSTSHVATSIPNWVSTSTSSSPSSPTSLTQHKLSPNSHLAFPRVSMVYFNQSLDMALCPPPMWVSSVPLLFTSFHPSWIKHSEIPLLSAQIGHSKPPSNPCSKYRAPFLSKINCGHYYCGGVYLTHLRA